MKSEKLYTTTEAGRILHTTEPTILRLLANGRLAGFQLVKKWRVFGSSVDNLMAGGRNGQGTSENSSRS